MTDYVVYHKAERMGYRAGDIESLAIYTNKTASGLTGARVWLIAGEGTPRTYRLRATFLIDKIEVSDNPKFKRRLSGTVGQFFDPMPVLNGQPWFPIFVEEQGRFAFGFNAIGNPEAERGFRSHL